MTTRQPGRRRSISAAAAHARWRGTMSAWLSRTRKRAGSSTPLRCPCSEVSNPASSDGVSAAPGGTPRSVAASDGLWHTSDKGRPRAEIRALYPADYEARGRDFAHFAPPGGESFAQAARRARAALKGILEGSGGDVAVVAHAGVNRALLCAAAGRPLQDLMTFPQRYCGVSTLRLTPDGLAVERVDELLWR